MRHVAESHAPQFLGVDVTMSQAKLLYLVSLHPGTSMGAIANELGVGPSAVSGLVDRLVSMGQLDRREDPDDRRQQLVTITTDGSASLERMRELRSEVMRRLLTGLDPAELEALRTSLIALDREVQRLEAHQLGRSKPDTERTTR
jgi:DNA-binding MarR family transcriptional regulator